MLFSLIASKQTYSQNYNPVINYAFNGTPTNGIKIKTKLPFTNGSQMPTITIEGYNYGQLKPIGLTLVYYIYGGNFYYPRVSSFGAYTPTIKLANENGLVVIFIDDKQYFNRFTVRAYANGVGEKASWFANLTITDEVLRGSNVAIVPYENSFAWNIYFHNGIWNESGNVGIGTTSPQAKLDVNGTARINGKLTIENDQFLFKTNDGGNGCIYFGYPNRTSGDLYFRAITSYDNIWGNHVNLMVIKNNGNVGIGTTTPRSRLDIGSTLGAEKGFRSGDYFEINELENYNNASVIGFNTYLSKSTSEVCQFSPTYSLVTGMLMKMDGGGSANIDFYGIVWNGATTKNLSDFQHVMRIGTNGNVGIGTTSPQSKLAVNGKITATEVEVTLTGWSDNVFYNVP